MNEHHGVPLNFDGAPSQHCNPAGAELLDDLVRYFAKYVRVPANEYAVLACWILHCHAFKAFSRTPYINVSSATNGCGKTQLLEVTELVVPEGLLVSSTTSAVLARAIDCFHPVLLMDELDQLLAGDKDLLAAVLATINSGYKKSGYRLVLEPQKGGGWATKKLSTYSPKMLSGISSLPAVTLSRCIPITMERMLPGDRVEEIDEFIIEPEAKALFHKASAWASKNLSQLRAARPAAPSELGHRQREVCRPLFAIGDLAGNGWGDRIRSAVTALFLVQAKEIPADIKVELLQDIRQAFDDKDRIASADLVSALVSMEERPWGAWGKSRKPMTQYQLAYQLKDFKVYAGSVRLDDGRNLKGYQRKWFEHIWARYLPPTDTQVVTSSQPAPILDETQFSGRHKESDVTSQKCEKPAPLLHCDDVTSQKPGDRVRQVKASEKPNGKPSGTLPSCGVCGSYYLYRTSAGIYECMSCQGN